MLNDRLLQNLVLAGMLLLAPLLHAGPLPDFEASYELKRGKLRIGTSSIALSTTADGRYLYESHSTPSRLVSWFLKDRLHETSRGTLNAAGVRPDEYHYQRRADKNIVILVKNLDGLNEQETAGESVNEPQSE